MFKTWNGLNLLTKFIQISDDLLHFLSLNPAKAFLDCVFAIIVS